MKSSLNKNNREADGFICSHCSKLVKLNRKFSGTQFRNHCPFCLWSVHLGQDWPKHVGPACKGEMEPVALTFKHEGWDKYGKLKQGELMVVHCCKRCKEYSFNRIAGDDNPDKLMETYRKSLIMDEIIKKQLEEQKIQILTKGNEKEILKQLFGKMD